MSVTIPTIRNKLDNQLQSRMLIADLRDYTGRVKAHSRAVSEQFSPGYVAAEHEDSGLAAGTKEPHHRAQGGGPRGGRALPL